MKIRSYLSILGIIGGLTFGVATVSAHCGTCGVGDEKKDHTHACPADCDKPCCKDKDKKACAEDCAKECCKDGEKKACAEGCEKECCKGKEEKKGS